MDLSKFKTDPTLEQEGVWVPLGDGRLRIARLNNPRMTAAYAAKIRPYRGGRVPDEESDRIMVDCLAEHVLLAWEGITHNGEPFPYSRANAKEALAIKDFCDFVIESAKQMELFQTAETKEAVEAIAKN
jgi:hypothetical protein